MLIEALLLLALLTIGPGRPAGKSEERITLVEIEAAEVPEEARETAKTEPASPADERPVPQRPAKEPLPREPAEPLLPQPAQAQAAPAAPRLLPVPVPVQPAPSAEVPRNVAPRASTGRRVYGPPDSGGSRGSQDSERVGTAPGGEPLYAAAWYREPAADMLRAYLSTANGPGWGLIACRTAPDYRVEDCVGLDEYPEGSQIKRAVLAAAWEFRVRPPRLGGRPQVGSWVRIRIDYSIKRR
ncbi:MAG TPA: hypothetical protein VF582_04640 [Allosphingosinicella sp.]